MKSSNSNACRLNDAPDPVMERDIEWILKNARTVAVVGLSRDPDRPSYQVARFLKECGYKIIPIRPDGKEILGEVVYPDLLKAPGHVDVVCIFRRPEHVLPIAMQAIKINASAIWMQEGIRNEEAAKLAREAGLRVVMDRCMSKETHKRRKEN